MKYIDNGGNEHEAELLECPFCGSEPELTFIGNDHTKTRKVVIECKKCRIQRTNAALRFSHEWLFNESVKQWNQRSYKPH